MFRVHSRLGNFPYEVAGKDMKLGTADDVAAEGGRTIVVQPFGGYQETQIEFCDTRGWGVSQQCNRANVYGFHAGDYNETWKQPWTRGARAGRPRRLRSPGAVGRVQRRRRACTCSWTASRRPARCCRKGACPPAP